ncbi:type II restriction enzyme HgiDI [Anopheles sinensis]|uniref:Type II restriction enzyme HgiDI n=1 Tax=Anopheles sinensis TaxID=74873 RepID=A0A084WDJ3_ANOSI|nr:type II restriction enzyme HgiDI [Anopheles sinensis]
MEQHPGPVQLLGTLRRVDSLLLDRKEVAIERRCWNLKGITSGTARDCADAVFTPSNFATCRIFPQRLASGRMTGYGPSQLHAGNNSATTTRDNDAVDVTRRQAPSVSEAGQGDETLALTNRRDNSSLLFAAGKSLVSIPGVRVVFRRKANPLNDRYKAS